MIVSVSVGMSVSVSVSVRVDVGASVSCTADHGTLELRKVAQTASLASTVVGGGGDVDVDVNANANVKESSTVSCIEHADQVVVVEVQGEHANVLADGTG